MARALIRIAAPLALLLTLGVAALSAQNRPLLPFQHTAWTLQDGAPSQIQRMAQTTDGYIWLATASGLFRFDGVTFEAYQLPHRQQFAHTDIQSLAADESGGLWIGYVQGDTSFLKNGVLKTHRFQNHAHRAGGRVHYMMVRRDGSIWAATDYGLLHLESGEWMDATETEGLDIKSSYCLFEDSRRTLWMATDMFVYRLPVGARKFEKTQLHPGANGHFTETPDGTVWIADEYGLHDVNDPFVAKSHLAFIDVPVDLSVDDSGAIWFFGYSTGVTRIEHPVATAKLPRSKQTRAIETFSIRNGLTSERGSKSLKDREGNLWIATSGGLDRFRPTTLTPAPLPDSFAYYAVAAEGDGSILIGTFNDGLRRLTGNRIAKVSTGRQVEAILPYRSPDGKLWIAGVSELGYIEGGRYTDVPVPPEMSITRGRAIQAITAGSYGDIWLQQDSKIGIFRLHNGHWSEVPNTSGRDPAAVMATDSKGRVWAGYTSGLLTIFDEAKRSDLNQEHGLTVGSVSALYPSPEGMWIGGQHGLNLASGDRPPVELRFAGDIKIEGISGIARTEDGTLWLNSLPGVLKISGDEVTKAFKNPNHAMGYRLFNYQDGLIGKPAQLRPLPTVIRGVGATVWFTTTNGVFSLDADHIRTNTLAPPLSIKELLVDGRKLDADASVTLSKGVTDLQIDYTALSLSIPERVRFRYKLEGYDKVWQDAGTRRQAFYTHLPPGQFTFHVIACNNDGLWNEVGASLPVILPPTFLQSWYFKALIAVFLLVTVSGAYLFRLRQVTRRIRTKFYDRFAERERIARDLHDTFFQGIQGLLLSFESASRRLSPNDPAKAIIDEALVQSDEVMLQGRELVLDLRTRSTETKQLENDLKTAALAFAGSYPAEFTVNVKGEPRALNSLVSEELYKLGREAINNAFRHSKGNHIEVEVDYGRSELSLTVWDNGCGISQDTLERGSVANHWGLPGMHERAAKMGGRLCITSRPKGGAVVQVRLPAAVAYQSEILRPRWMFLQSLLGRENEM